MSHDDNGHGQEKPKPSNPFFIIGFVLFAAFFALQARTTPPSQSVPVKIPQKTRVTPAPIEPIVEIQKPTYNINILTAPGPIPDKLKKEPQVSSIAPWNYALTFASKTQVLTPLLEGQTFQQKHTIKTINAGPEGNMIEEAAVKLTPYEIQLGNMKLITYVQHLTANHKNCYYDEEGGNEHVPDEGVFQPDAIGWNKLRGGSKVLHSTMSVGKLPLSGYDLFNTLPDETVTPQNGLPCGTQMEGDPIKNMYEMGDNEEKYNGTDRNVFTASEFCSAGALQKYDECMATPPQPDPKHPGKMKPKSCDLKCGKDAHTLFSNNLPAADEVNTEFGQGPNGEKEGFTLTRIPSELTNFTKRNGTNTQDHTLKIPLCYGCEVTSEKSVYYLEALRREVLKSFNCSITPQEIQDPNDPCVPPESAPTDEDKECAIDIIEKIKPKEASCKLCNAGALKSFLTPNLEAKAVPNGLSPLAIKVLEAAADTYHVPASMLVATMLHEGSFEHPEVWTWSSDETIKKFSDCKVKKPMPSCDAFGHPVTGAKGPFGFIDKWWEKYMSSDGPYKNLLKDPKTKSEFAKINLKNVSSCNFVDAAFMAARGLGEDQSHLYVPGIPLSCPAVSGYPATTVYQGGDPPGSCGVWKADRAALARLQYGNRICSADTSRVVAMYSAMRCGGN